LHGGHAEYARCLREGKKSVRSEARTRLDESKREGRGPGTGERKGERGNSCVLRKDHLRLPNRALFQRRPTLDGGRAACERNTVVRVNVRNKREQTENEVHRTIRERPLKMVADG